MHLASLLFVYLYLLEVILTRHVADEDNCVLPEPRNEPSVLGRVLEPSRLHFTYCTLCVTLT